MVGPYSTNKVAPTKAPHMIRSWKTRLKVCNSFTCKLVR